jgi:hypothetical protein
MVGADLCLLDSDLRVDVLHARLADIQVHQRAHSRTVIR